VVKPQPKPLVPAYLVPYCDALACHGPTFGATLWKSRRSQRVRFRVLTRMIDLRDLIVLDAGCGLGDLAAYLADRRIPVRRYLGVDALPDLICQATRRSLPNTEFIHADFAGDPVAFQSLARTVNADAIVFSGSLNTFDQPFALRVLDHAFAAARVGIVFNFLSTSSPKPPKNPGDPARRFDPDMVLAWALARTPLVRFRSDYLRGQDATIAMLKSLPRSTPH
jgi:SAM-dependent methyltransferase